MTDSLHHTTLAERIEEIGLEQEYVDKDLPSKRSEAVPLANIKIRFLLEVIEHYQEALESIAATHMKNDHKSWDKKSHGALVDIIVNDTEIARNALEGNK